MPIEYSKHSDMPIPAHPESFLNNRTTTKKGRESILFAFYLGSAASIHSSRSFCIMTTYYYSVTGIASFVRIYISMVAPGFTNSRKNNCVVSKVRRKLIVSKWHTVRNIFPAMYVSTVCCQWPVPHTTDLPRLWIFIDIWDTWRNHDNQLRWERPFCYVSWMDQASFILVLYQLWFWTSNVPIYIFLL